jgi:asparagine synthase (glutamine-hydrolysing)
MCGIAGIFNFERNTHIDIEMLARMGISLAHRGPDDEGIFVDSEGYVGFAHRRLSIIDLSGGRQPISNEQGDVWIVFNGEIYNYPELKEQLDSLGHLFRTKSDTEVIVHAYEQWGLDCLSHLNGMFALALWDSAKKRLMLARDHAGIKPLYYTVNDGTLFFGSEIRALFATGIVTPSIDLVGMNLFLRYQYTPSPHTVFEGVKKLGAGSRLVVEHGRTSVDQWWDFSPLPFDPLPSEKQAEEETVALYEGAVKRHLLSDVPIGLLLSGGLDSTLLLALMNRFGKAWPTFTVGYGSSFKDDELPDAARTAEHFGARHRQIEIDRSCFEEELPKIVRILEEPVASASVVPMYFLCQRVRQDLKTVLMGQGPDELFCGYKRHIGVEYGRYWRGIPGPLKSALSSCLEAVPRNEAIKRGLFSLGIEDRIERYEQVFSMLSNSSINELFHPDLLPDDIQQRALSVWNKVERFARQADELGGFSLMEMRYFLPDELLLYGDKLSMAHGLEIRVPYLDRTVVEYVQCLPSFYKVHLFTRKWLHRRVCERFIPDHVLRQRKKNFAANIVDGWFRDSMTGLFATVFDDDSSTIYRYLDASKVRKLVANHVSGRSDYHKFLYSLIVLEQWMRSYIV